MLWSKSTMPRTAIASLLTLPLMGCAFLAEYPITSASVGVWGTTGKGPTDHAVSYAFDEDCETFRAINSEPICKKVNTQSAEVVDKSFNLETPKNQLYPETHPAIQRPPNTGRPQVISGLRKNQRLTQSSKKKKRSFKKSTHMSIHGDSYQQS